MGKLQLYIWIKRKRNHYDPYFFSLISFEFNTCALFNIDCRQPSLFSFRFLAVPQFQELVYL